jgi:hypothetical protein
MVSDFRQAESCIPTSASSCVAFWRAKQFQLCDKRQAIDFNAFAVSHSPIDALA